MLNLSNACYHFVQNLLTFYLKMQKMKYTDSSIVSKRTSSMVLNTYTTIYTHTHTHGILKAIAFFLG